jgi:hypothetical protein
MGNFIISDLHTILLLGTYKWMRHVANMTERENYTKFWFENNTDIIGLTVLG